MVRCGLWFVLGPALLGLFLGLLLVGSIISWHPTWTAGPGDPPRGPLRLALKLKVRSSSRFSLPACGRPLKSVVFQVWRLRSSRSLLYLGWEFRGLRRRRRRQAATARNTKPSSSTQVRRRRTEDSRRKRLASLTTEGTSMEGNVYPDACQTSRADSTKIRSATFCPTRRRARTPTRTTAAQ